MSNLNPNDPLGTIGSFLTDSNVSVEDKLILGQATAAALKNIFEGKTRADTAAAFKAATRGITTAAISQAIDNISQGLVALPLEAAKQSVQSVSQAVSQIQTIDADTKAKRDLIVSQLFADAQKAGIQTNLQVDQQQSHAQISLTSSARGGLMGVFSLKGFIGGFMQALNDMFPNLIPDRFMSVANRWVEEASNYNANPIKAEDVIAQPINPNLPAQQYLDPKTSGQDAGANITNVLADTAKDAGAAAELSVNTAGSQIIGGGTNTHNSGGSHSSGLALPKVSNSSSSTSGLALPKISNSVARGLNEADAKNMGERVGITFLGANWVGALVRKYGGDDHIINNAQEKVAFVNGVLRDGGIGAPNATDRRELIESINQSHKLDYGVRGRGAPAMNPMGNSNS